MPEPGNHDASDPTSAAAAPHDDHGGFGKYYAVFAALCVLTTGSFMTYFDFWEEHFSDHVGWAFMMAISCTKASLVILFFMHLKYEANWKYVLTIPAGMMSIFLMLMLVPDVGLRRDHYTKERDARAAEAVKQDDHDKSHGESVGHGLPRRKGAPSHKKQKEH